jgi:hypothetical protein
VSEYLVIVESPAKAKTIERYLGSKYKVRASMGHVRDLPRSQMGMDVENNFSLKYITIRGKGPVLKELKAAAKKVKKVFLASDPDREGEAIARHLPTCNGDKIVERKSKKNRIFYGCSSFPACKFISWDKPLPRNCPKCKRLLVEKKLKKGVQMQCLECDYKENHQD